MSQETETTQTKVGVSLVLNGGKPEMNSATIPIRWWFSKEVIAKNPEYILFFEQSLKEKNSKSWDSAKTGRRYVSKVSEAVKFLQLFSPGYHRLMALVFTGDGNEEIIKHKLHQEYKNCYTSSIDWQEDEFSTIVEFEVPEQLFAEKPKTRMSQMVWKWANLWFEEEPTDQCDYRKRRIIAFTLQPVAMLLFWMIKYFLVGTIYTGYILIASLAILFAGYRPRPIFKEMWRAFTFQRYEEWDVKRFQYWDLPPSRRSLYRVWSYDKHNIRYMPIAPWFVTLIIVAIAGLVLLIKFLLLTKFLSHGDIFVKILFIGGALGLLLFLVSYSLPVYLKKTESERAAKNREKRRQEEIEKKKQRAILEKEEREWLLENFEFSKQTPEVFLNNLPQSLNASERVIQKFRVGFWALKAKICKPFSE